MSRLYYFVSIFTIYLSYLSISSFYYFYSVIYFFLLTGVVSYVTRDIILLPDIKLFMDVMRRHLSTYGFSISIHFRNTPFTLYASIRLGNTWPNHCTVRFDKKFCWRRDWNCLVSRLTLISYLIDLYLKLLLSLTRFYSVLI